VQGKASASFHARFALRAALACALGMIMTLAAPLPARAQVYKWVDENGVITFSNIAPPQNQDYQVLRFPCYAADPKCRSVSWEKVPLNTQAFHREIRSAAEYNAVEESLIRAIIHAESAYQPDARSPKGAQGLMQLMPATAADLDVSNPSTRRRTRWRSAPPVAAAGGIQRHGTSPRRPTTRVRTPPTYGGYRPMTKSQEYVRRPILYKRYDQAL
jgi:soluble lytic murein transglycosylase-like protein